MSHEDNDLIPPIENECGGYYCSEEQGHIDCLFSLIADATNRPPPDINFVGTQNELLKGLKRDHLGNPDCGYDYFLWCPASESADGQDWWMVWRRKKAVGGQLPPSDGQPIYVGGDSVMPAAVVREYSGSVSGIAAFTSKLNEKQRHAVEAHLAPKEPEPECSGGAIRAVGLIGLSLLGLGLFGWLLWRVVL